MTQTAQSMILWPRPAIAGCVFCLIVRDTRGVRLDHSQRFNFFPASPLCCITWVFEGDVIAIDQADQMERPWSGARWPRFAFSGAQRGPLVSWNPGETFVVTLAFYPDAFAAMSGLDLGSFAGRVVPADEVLGEHLLAPCCAFFDVARQDGVEAALSLLERDIERIWIGVRPAGAMPVRWLRDWTRSLVLRAALSAPGRSSRQIARRVKSWTGVSERDLALLGHSEQLYAKMHAARQDSSADWAGLAVASGFADQAHMIRRLRQHTGFTPEQLRRSAASDEALWAYRLLGQYFTDPHK